MKEPTRITYLFGAGASIGTTKEWLKDQPGAVVYYSYLNKLKSGIPITSDLNIFRHIFAQVVGKEKGEWQSHSKDSFITGEGLWFLFAKRLKRSFTSQLSPDTFGRMLRISNRPSAYDEFKKQLALFINLCDALSLPDARYANLLANFINIDSGVVSENINFLTYNFDSAPEKSFLNFLNEKEYSSVSLAALRAKYGIAFSKKSFENLKTKSGSTWLKLHGSAADFQLNSDEISVLKLGKPEFENMNSLFPPDPYRSTEIASEDDSGKRKIHAFDAIAHLYHGHDSPLNNAQSSVRFAWDVKDGDNVMSIALNNLKKTKILVAVGYTFPAFNQRNDLKMLRALSHGGFDKIIIQLPEGDGAEVRKRVLEMFKNLATPIPESKVELVTDCTAFHIPVEYFSNEKIIHETSEPFFG